jgi:hypothetical protein
MDYSEFQRMFYPLEDAEEDDRVPVEQNKEKIEARIRNLDIIIKQTFANKYKSVRKAFLDVDKDFDGSISAQEIVRLLGRANIKRDF